jgi:hypothetical protein
MAIDLPLTNIQFNFTPQKGFFCSSLVLEKIVSSATLSYFSVLLMSAFYKVAHLIREGGAPKKLISALSTYGVK